MGSPYSESGGSFHGVEFNWLFNFGDLARACESGFGQIHDFEEPRKQRNKNLITTLTNPARRTDTMRARNIIIIIVVVNVAWGGFYLATTTPSLAWPGEGQHDAGEHKMEKWKAETIRDREAVQEAEAQECVGIIKRMLEINEHILSQASTQREYYEIQAEIYDELDEAAGRNKSHLTGDCEYVIVEGLMDEREYMARANATAALFNDLPYG